MEISMEAPDYSLRGGSPDPPRKTAGDRTDGN
jgi:hypothetical protein